jgi:hypothetical protein
VSPTPLHPKGNRQQICRTHPPTILLLWLLILHIAPTYSQNTYTDKNFQFLSYGKIPTWVGVATNWNTQPNINLYDGSKYKGHAAYISLGLKTGISFQQFKAQVSNPQTRNYIPFFLYDLRDLKLTIDNSTYDWALRIEDYGYRDTPQQMQQTALKLLRNIAAYIAQQTGTSTHGLIILPTNPKATPNSSIATAMQQGGYPSITLSEMLTKVNGQKAEVLNPGTAIGYLRYIPEGNTSYTPTPKDILIYENLPQRVPPVNGIITLQAQTPLSHINLLAKNRGTINLYTTDLSYLPGAAKLLNKLVRIECNDKKITISAVSEKEATKFWSARVHKLEIPQPNSVSTQIVSLNLPNAHQSTQHIGAKASNYALIRQLLPQTVPQGFAIPFAHYIAVLKTSGADTLIHALVKQKPVEKERNILLQKIRNTILTAKLKPSLIQDLNTHITQQFHNERIRLRSSTNCEDLPEFNGAGLYLSKGYDKSTGDKVLENKILQVYASLWQPLAYQEREYYLIDHGKVAMAILITPAFTREYANGVAITTKENGKISVFINTQYGENSVTNPQNGQIPESIVYETAQNEVYQIRSRSSLHDILLQNELKNQLTELKKMVLKIHDILTKSHSYRPNTQFGVDIEFKIMYENRGYKLYIKQARLLQSVLPY